MLETCMDSMEFCLLFVFNLLFYFLCVGECFACTCVYIPHVCSAQEGQKRVLGPQELKLEKVMSHQVGTEN